MVPSVVVGRKTSSSAVPTSVPLTSVTTKPASDQCLSSISSGFLQSSQRIFVSLSCFLSGYQLLESCRICLSSFQSSLFSFQTTYISGHRVRSVSQYFIASSIFVYQIIQRVVRINSILKILIDTIAVHVGDSCSTSGASYITSSVERNSISCGTFSGINVCLQYCNGTVHLSASRSSIYIHLSLNCSQSSLGCRRQVSIVKQDLSLISQFLCICFCFSSGDQRFFSRNKRSDTRVVFFGDTSFQRDLASCINGIQGNGVSCVSNSSHTTRNSAANSDGSIDFDINFSSCSSIGSLISCFSCCNQRGISRLVGVISRLQTSNLSYSCLSLCNGFLRIGDVFSQGSTSIGDQSSLNSCGGIVSSTVGATSVYACSASIVFDESIDCFSSAQQSSFYVRRGSIWNFRILSFTPSFQEVGNCSISSSQIFQTFSERTCLAKQKTQAAQGVRDAFADSFRAAPPISHRQGSEFLPPTGICRTKPTEFARWVPHRLPTHRPETTPSDRQSERASRRTSAPAWQAGA